MKKPMFWTGLLIGSLVGYAASFLKEPLIEDDKFKVNTADRSDIGVKNSYNRSVNDNDFSDKINNLDKTLQKINSQKEN